MYVHALSAQRRHRPRCFPASVTNAMAAARRAGSELQSGDRDWIPWCVLRESSTHL